MPFSAITESEPFLKIADFRLLKKLMNMTLSGADAERLFAIDKANEIIKKSNTTWDRVLDRTIKVEVEIEARPEPKTADERSAARAAFVASVDDAFKVIEASDPRGEAADFIASLKEQWADGSGRLSSRQLEALRTFERNARKKVEA